MRQTFDIISEEIFTSYNDSDIGVEEDDRTVGEVPSKMLPALLIDTLKTEN